MFQALNYGRQVGNSLPSVSRPGEGPQTFKLTVRVLAASIPGIEAPGYISSDRPYIQASVGGTQKATEFADYCPKEPSNDMGSQLSQQMVEECPWRFSDSLTFRCPIKDVAGPGLKLELHVRRDVSLWPATVQMRPVKVAQGLVDLKTRVLHACERKQEGASGVDLGTRAFMSPVVVIGMSHVKGGTLGESVQLGEAVAHVALVFSLDADPEEILLAAGMRPRRRSITAAKERVEATKGRMTERMETTRGRLTERLQTLRRSASLESLRNLRRSASLESMSTRASLESFRRSASLESVRQSPAMENLRSLRRSSSVERLVTRAESTVNTARARLRSSSLTPSFLRRKASGPRSRKDLGDGVVPDPDLDPEGWVSLRGPDGREFWHHLSAGPPPWQGASTIRADAESCGPKAGDEMPSSHAWWSPELERMQHREL